VAKNYFKLIEAYVAGELTGSELSDFIQELARNPELAKQVNLSRDLDKFLYDDAARSKFIENLNRIEEEYMKSRKDKQNPETDN